MLFRSQHLLGSSEYFVFSSIRHFLSESSRDEPRWRETVDAGPGVTECDGVYRKANVRYLSRWPDAAHLAALFAEMAYDAGLVTTDLPADLRIRRAGDLIFAFNYGPDALELTAPFPRAASFDYIVGGPRLAPAAVAVWRTVG